jgi:hypothetical protein
MQMPVPTAPGALPAAFRVVCIRCVRRMVGHTDHRCSFGSGVSSKCTHCTRQRGNCTPVGLSLIRFQFEADMIQLPWFVGPEYTALALALRDDDGDAIEAAAQELDRVLRLASAGLPKDTDGLLLGLLEETRALRSEVSSGFAELHISHVVSGTLLYYCMVLV